MEKMFQTANERDEFVTHWILCTYNQDRQYFLSWLKIYLPEYVAILMHTWFKITGERRPRSRRKGQRHLKQFNLDELD